GQEPCGSFGQAAAVSFNGNKIMTTSGGGALLTDDDRLAEYAAYLSAQAREPVAHYEHREIGFNYRLSNLLAALGRAQLTRLHGMIDRRRAIRQRYDDSIVSPWEGITLFGADNPHRDNAWLSAILVDEQRAGFSAAPMHGGQVSESLFASGLTMPSGSALSETDVDRIIETVIDFISCPKPQFDRIA